MFGKVLKYDIRSIGRFFWIIAVSVLGLSALASVAMRFVDEFLEYDALFLISFFAMLFIMMAFVAIVASVVVTEILVFMRFYKHFFTDEGYLTFTLPVSRKTLLLSKTVNALIWTALHIVLLIVAIFIFVLIGIPSDNGGLINTEILRGIGDIFTQMWRSVGPWCIVFIIEGVLLMAFGILFSVSLVHMCITVGAIIAKKLKLLAAIGIYYGVNTVLSSILPVLGLIPAISLIEGFTEKLSYLSVNMRLAAIAIILMIVCLAIAAMAFIIYSITLDRLERGLNLA